MIWSPPDVLVLGAGGILGEAWMSSLLAGLEAESEFDARECSGYVGTSAGSIVAAALAGGVRPSTRLGKLPEQPPVPEGVASAEGSSSAGAPSSAVRRGFAAAAALGASAATPLASLALSSTASGGALVRRAALARVPRGRMSLSDLRREMQRLGVGWDGRLRIAAVELESGRRVVFGEPDSPDVPVADAVLASCAIPGVFRPLSFEGRTYVDGGAWSLTNMDAAQVAYDERVLCLNPTASIRPALASPTAAITPWSRSVAAAEALVLRRRGATVDVVNPDRASAEAMGSNFMDSRPRARVIAAGFEQGRRLAGGVRAAHAAESSHA